MILIYQRFFFFIFDRLKTFPKQLDSKTVQDHSNISVHTWNYLNTKNPLNKSKFYLFKPKIADNLLYIKSDRQIEFINTNFICIQFCHQNKLNPYRQNTYHNFSTIENSFICSKKCVSTILDLMYFFFYICACYLLKYIKTVVHKPGFEGHSQI